MPGGNWTEDDLNNYDGYQNRGHIKDLWQEAFDMDDTESWVEFQDLFHANEDFAKIMEFID